MTERQKKVIAAARAIPARFVEIERTTRSTAARNEAKRWAAKREEMFATERARLVRTWNKGEDNGQ